MLKTLILKNWKSFQQAELAIGPLTVLIGTNASGKSNVLDALQFLNRIAQGQEFKTALMGNAEQLPLRGGADWAALKPHDQFTLEVWVGSAQDDMDYEYCLTIAIRPEIFSMRESLTQITYEPDSDQVRDSQTLYETQIDPADPVMTVCRFNQGDTFNLRRSYAALSRLEGLGFSNAHLNQGVAIVVTALKNILILDPIPSRMRDYSPLSDTLLGDASNIAGVLAGLSSPRKADVEAQITHYVTQLPERDIAKIWAEPVGRLSQDAMLYCDELWMSHQPASTIDARGMSDGTLRFLAIITALLTQPEGSQIVIEEVENGLHPSRAHLLLEMLQTIGKKRQIDILVTTHNPALLDEITPDMLPDVVGAFRDPDNGVSRLIPVVDLQNLPQILAIGSLGRAATRGTIGQSLQIHPLGVR